MLIATTRSAQRMHQVVRVLMLVCMLAFQFSPSELWANPTGGQVAAGQAGFSVNGSTLTITQGSQNAVINWQNFSIGTGEVTSFLQPNSLSSVLNRVISNNPSAIYGTLKANGNVLLINQNGILVGPGAVIDTNSFLASTLNVSDADFMAGGDLKFIGDSGAAIQNLGSITARGGDVYLIAQQIQNDGDINAAGTAGLLAGTEVLLKAAGDNRGSVLVGSTGPVKDGAAITNSGQVQSAMATMEATGSMYSVAVNNSGTVRATGASVANGRVMLTAGGADIQNSGTISANNADGSGGQIDINAGNNSSQTATVYNSGTLDASGYASGAKGGSVNVTGDRVALTGNAVVNVSGDAGGGTAKIGGGLHGTDSSVANASRTYVGANAQIKADAVTSGDGGTVTVWSDDGTQFYGSVSAKGGSQSGNGGSAEVSGKNYLDYRGVTNLTAANGATGTLLLDPTDITIQTTGPDSVESTAGSPFIFSDASSDGPSPSILTVATLQTQLGLSDVLVDTTSAAADAGNILVSNAVTWSSGNALELRANNNITINADITATASPANILLTADSDNNGTGTLSVGDGTALETVTSNGGNITITAADVALNTTATMEGKLNAGAGTVSITATNNGTIALGDGVGTMSITGGELQNITATTLNLTSTASTTTAINVNNVSAANSNNVGTVNLDASGGTDANISFDTAASTFNALSATASGVLSVGIGLTVDTGALSLTAQSTTANPALDITAAISSTAAANSGAITLRGDTMNIGSTVTSTNQQTVTLRANQATTTIDVGTGTDTAGTQLGLSSAELNNIDADGGGTGTIVIGSNTNTGGITVSAAIAPANTGNLQLTTDGSIALQNTVTVANNLRLTSGANGTAASTTTQAATAGITAAGLATSGAGSVDLTSAAATNTFSKFASNSGNSVDVTGNGTFAIDAVGAISGISIGSNALTLTSTTGDINQNVLAIAGNTTLDADNLNITNTNNQFTGTVTLTAGTDAIFHNKDAGGTSFGSSNITNNFTFVSDSATGGGVTQSGPLSVGGSASFSTNANGLTIDLSNAGNDFAGNLSFVTNGTTTNVTVMNNDAAGTTLDTTTVTGDLTLTQTNQTGALIGQVAASVITVGGQATFINKTSDTGDVTLKNTAAGGTVFGTWTGPPADTLVSGDLSINSTGPVTQTGAVRVAGDFSSTASSTTLTRSDNVFAGTYTSSDGSVFVSRVGDVDVNQAVTGTTASNVNVAGSLTVIALQNGEEFSGVTHGNAIVLDQNNVFNGGVVVQSGAQTTSPTSAASNNIFETANVTVAGTSTFNAPIDTTAGANLTGAIDLTTGGFTNTLSGAIQFAGQSVTLTNTGTTNLGASTTRLSTGTGDFTISSTQAISNSGALDILGASSFTTTTAGQGITLGNAGNKLDGAVTLSTTGAGNISLTNNEATLLGNVTETGGNFSINSNGTITQNTGTKISQTVGGALNVTTTAGDAVLTSMTNAILTLNNVSTAGNFTLYEDNGYSLTGTVSVGGYADLGMVNAGTVSQTGGSITTTNGLLLEQANTTTATTSEFDLDSTTNDVKKLASKVNFAGSILNNRYVTSTSFAVDTVNLVNGISTGGGDVRIDARSPASVTFTQDVNLGTGGSLVATAGGGDLIQNGGVIKTNTGHVYLSARNVGTSGNPILTQGTSASNIQLSAQSTVGGLYINNQSGGNLDIVTYDPPNAGFLDPSSNAPSIAGIVSATSTSLQNSASGAGNGGINLVGTGNIAAGTTVTISNAGALTQDSLTTRVTGTQLTLQGTGDVGVLGGNAIISNVPIVAFSKSTSGNVHLTNAASTQVQGDVNGNMLFSTSAGNITINASNLVNHSASNTFELNGAVQIINGGGYIDMDGGNLALFSGQIGSGVDLQLRNVGTLEAQATAGPVNIVHDYTAAFGLTGNTLTLGDVTNPAGSAFPAFAGITATTGQVSIQQAANNNLVVANTSAATDIGATSNVTLSIASSGTGADQLFVNTGAVIQAGSGSGGSITIRGGVNNQGSVGAGLGTTVLLDGGRPDLILSGSQTYNSSVTFQANDDLIVTGSITQTNAAATTTFTADFDNNGQGGFLLYNDGATNTGSISAAGGASALISITGSNLINNTYADLNGNFTYGGLVGNGVVISRSDTNSAVNMGNNGAINLISKDPLGTAQNNVVVDGRVFAGTGGNISIDSDYGLAMGRNINAGGNVVIQNDGIAIRTQVAATILAGSTLTFSGSGNLGTDPTLGTVTGALLGFDSLGKLKTTVGVMDFDSAGGSKATSSAYISETDAVNIEGQLAFLNLDSGNVINDATNNLIIDSVVLNAGGAINLGNLGHQIGEFQQVTAKGSITYTGIRNLDISGLVQGNSSSTVTIDVTGFDLTQTNANADIEGKIVKLDFNNGFLQANVEGVDALGNAARANEVDITNSGTLIRTADTSLIRSTVLNLQGGGDVGTSLADGLRTRITDLEVIKATGDVYVYQPNSDAEITTNFLPATQVLVNADIGGAAFANFNLATETSSIKVGSTGITASNASNVSLIAGGTSGVTTITTQGGLINMDGGNLLLVARNGIGTKAAPILTADSYNLAATNTGTDGGIFINNSLFDGPTADVVISDVADFTPTSTSTPVTFNGVYQASTGNTGATAGNRNIRIVNIGGNIGIGDRIQNAVNNQQVLLVANQAGGKIFEQDADGVINLTSGSQLYLLADSGIGDVNNAILTSGSYSLAAQSTNDSIGNVGGIYITGVGNSGNTFNQANAAFNTGTITISSFGETGGGFATITGVTTQSPGTDADIRIRNAAGTGSNIVVDNVIQASVGFGGNTVELIADNGAITQGGSGNGLIISDTDGVNPGEILLAARQGIGTTATALKTEGNYNLAVKNDVLSLSNSATTASGNVNILNTGVDALLSGTGNITITDVADVFTNSTAGDVNVRVGTGGIVSGGQNTADAASSGAIKIQNSATGVGAGDIIAVNTSVTTTGTSTGTASITLIAADDLEIGDGATQTAPTIISTQNGAITLTASNGNPISGGDSIDGILITASDTTGSANTLVSAGGTGGAVTVNATAGSGYLTVQGGSAANTDATLFSNAAMIVNANLVEVLGGNGTSSNAAITANGNQTFNISGSVTYTSGPFTGASLALYGGSDGTSGASALISQLGGTGTQTINLTTGNLQIVGGSGTNTASAAILHTGSGQQIIDVASGDLDLTGGTGAIQAAPTLTTNAEITSAGIINDSSSLQHITVSGDVVLQGGSATNTSAVIQSQGAQTIDPVNILLTGGSADGSFAMIEALGAQSITADEYIDLEGGTNGSTVMDNFSVIYGHSTQNITVNTTDGSAGTGGLLINGNAANSASGTYTFGITTQPTPGAGIVANNTQSISVHDGGITINGGTEDGATAGIYMTLNTTSQTIAVSGVNASSPANAIELNGGTQTTGLAWALINSAHDQIIGTSGTRIAGNIAVTGGASGTNNQAFINSESGAQSIYNTGNVTITGGATGTDNFAYIGSQGSSQTINTTGNLTVQGGGTTPGSDTNDIAGIEAAGTAEPQTITVGGNALIDGGAADVSPDATFTAAFGGAFQPAAAGIASKGKQVIGITGSLTINGGSGLAGAAGIESIDTSTLPSYAQAITVTGTTTLTGGNNTGTFAGISAAAGAQYFEGTGLIDLKGGSAPGTDNYAVIYGADTQDIIAHNGLTIEGLEGSSPSVSFGVFGSVGANNGMGAGIVADNTQNVTVISGDLTITGGDTAGSGAGIEQTTPGITQTILVEGTPTIGNLVMTGGTGTDAFAWIDSQGLQNIGTSGTPIAGNVTVQGGPAAGNTGAFAAITAVSSQVIDVTGDLNVYGSQNSTASGNDNYAAIVGNVDQTITVGGEMDVSANEGSSSGATPLTTAGLGAAVIAGAAVSGTSAQSITVNGGDLTVTGGSDGIGSTGALVQQADTASDQTIKVIAGSVLVTGGSDQDAYAQIDSQFTQHIGTSGTPISGNIVLQGGPGAGNTGAYAAATAVSSQFLYVAGDLDVYGSQSSTASGNDNYAAVIGDVDQTIVVGGAMNVLANEGSSSGAAPLTTAGLGAAVIAGAAVSGTSAQSITVNGGDLTVTGGSDGIGSTGALVQQADTTSDQTIKVIAGSVLVTGGSDQDAYAQIDSQFTQHIGTSGTPISGNIVLQGGPGAGNTGAYAAATAVSSQFLYVAGDLDVYGSQSSTASGNDNYAAVVGDVDQTIVVGGAMDVSANEGSSAFSGPLAGISTGLGAAVVAGAAGAGAQLITVNGGDLTVTGGSDDIGFTAAVIWQQDSGSDQGINVTDGSIFVTGGTDTFGFAQIDSRFTQEIGKNSPISGDITIQAGGSGANFVAFAAITAANSQSLDVTGNLYVYGSQAATPLAGSLNDNYGLIMGDLMQTITVGGAMTVQAFQGSSFNNGPLAGTSGLGAAVIAGAAGAGSQYINVGTGGVSNLTVTGGSDGIGSTGALVQQADSGSDQGIDVNGSIILTGGTDADAFAWIEAAYKQEIGKNAAISFDVHLQGGGSGSNTGAFAAISAVDSQSLDVGNGLQVYGSNAASTLTGPNNDNYAAIIGNLDQTITVAAYMDVSANQGSSSGAAPLTGFSGLGAAVIAGTAGAGDQIIDVGTGGFSNLQVTGGSDNVGSTAAGIFQQDATSDQSIDVNGNILVTGGTDGNAYAQIHSAHTQEIGDSADVSGFVTLQGGAGNTGGGGGGAFAEIDAADNQSLHVNSNLSVLANTDNTGGNNGYALITSDGAVQDIAVHGSTGITLTGGATDGDYAAITATNAAGAQTVFANFGGLTMNGGTNGSTVTNNYALIEDSGTLQSITIKTGITLNGNDGNTSGTIGNYRFGAGIVSDGSGTQSISTTAGSLTLNGGTSPYAAAVIDQAVAAQQTINIAGGGTTLTGGSDTGTFAIIHGLDVQMITSAQAMTLNGGSANDDDFAAIVGDSTQTVNVTTGNLTLNGNEGVTAAVNPGSYVFGAGIVSDTAGTQTINVSAGSIDMNGGDGPSSAVVIDQEVAANQHLNVSTNVTLDGGSADDAFALVVSAGTQNIDHNGGATSGNLVLTGGVDPANRVYAAIQSTGAQSIKIGTGIDLEGGSSTGDDDYALIYSQSTQTITDGSGGMVLNGNMGNSTSTIGNFGVALPQGVGAVVVADDTQNVTVSGGGLTINGGTANDSAAGIDMTAGTKQTVNITGNVALTGGNGQNATADIYSVTDQDFTASGNLTLTGNMDAANGNAWAEIWSGGVQNVTVNGTTGITMTGGMGAGDYAYVFGTTSQTIHVNNGGISLTGGAVGGDNSGDRDATIQTNGPQIITTAKNITLTGHDGYYHNSNSFHDYGSANILAGTTQSITSGGNLSLQGGEGNAEAFATVMSEGVQTINAVNISVTGGAAAGAIIGTAANQTLVASGNLTVQGGSGADTDAVIYSEGATQSITVSGNASLNDGTGAGSDALIHSDGNQTITSSGTTNLTGDNGNQSFIDAVGTVVLNNAGGTWSGNANVASPVSVTINNSGPITVSETTGSGAVTTPILIFTGGQGTVGDTGAPGSASTRLNTVVDQIHFNGVGSKTVNISETDGVALQGTIGTVNLILDNAGDITETGVLNATNATLQTASGNIDLSTQTNGVQNFKGVVANGGSFSYLGGQDVTVKARAKSAEIPAGADLFASNTITIDVGGNVIYLDGGTKIAGTAPGAGDGFILSGSDQTYQSRIVLMTDYRIHSDGSGTPASDNIIFNGRIDGPGGLQVGSTPMFNNYIGSLTPLAYLYLNSNNSYFNQPDASTSGAYTAVMNGNFVNNGTMNLSGPKGNYTFITDNGFVGSGNSLFTGGIMNLGGSTITIYASAQSQTTGSLLPSLANYNSWNGNPFTPLLPFASNAIFYKAPPPQEEIKEKKNLRRDDLVHYLVDYQGSDMGGSTGMITTDAGGVQGGLTVSSFTALGETTGKAYYFGLETQAPVPGLDPGQLVNENTPERKWLP